MNIDLPTVTPENYYSHECDTYLSNSQRKGWVSCPRGAYARYIEHDPKAEEPRKKVFAEGGLLDALLLDPSDIPRVEDENREFLFNKVPKPTKKVPNPVAPRSALYDDTVAVANYVKTLPTVMDLIDDCEKQRIIVFQMGGIPCKCRLDMLDLTDGFIWDMKYMQSLTKTEWSPEHHRRVHWIIAYDYMAQLAVYQEAVKQEIGEEFLVGLLGISKPTPAAPTPDIRAIYWNEESISQVTAEIRRVELQMKMIDGWRRGDPSQLHRCENCEYCRKTGGLRYELFTDKVD
jgi:hypothetical protein